MNEREERARRKIRAAYRHEAVREPSVVIGDVNYWLFGEAPAAIPGDYFTDWEVHREFQEAKIRRHLEQIDDDYLPMLLPWFGTGVVPSALGCRVAFQPGMDPVAEGGVVREPADVGRLREPDPERDGLMPRVLSCIRYLRARSPYPVSFTDCQGPLNIALTLCGAERFFLWLYEHPQAAHALMDFSAEVLIRWVKAQKRAAGQPLEGGAFPHGIWLPEGFGGVWISDDDCAVISAAQYREFVVPYNARVLKSFGGGTIHFCGTAVHQIENFLRTEGLTGINNFCMGDFRSVARMQEAFAGRLALMVCDFTPRDVEAYYSEVIRVLNPKGTVLAAYPTATVALEGGKYTAVERDAAALAVEVHRVIRSRLASKT
jgi:uroporphyrinogen-III decarboxylase